MVADGVDAPVGEPGELWVWSSHAGGRYLDAPDLQEQTMVVDADGERWFRIGDLGQLLPDGRLLVGGRNDTRVKVNGLAVDLTAVARRGARDRRRRRRRGVGRPAGRRHAARRVDRRRPGRVPVRARPPGRSPAHLPRFMFPHVFRAVSEIPRLPNGKVDRMALRTAAAAAVPTGADAAAARDAQRTRARRLVRNRARPT